MVNAAPSNTPQLVNGDTSFSCAFCCGEDVFSLRASWAAGEFQRLYVMRYRHLCSCLFCYGTCRVYVLADVSVSGGTILGVSYTKQEFSQVPLGPEPVGIARAATEEAMEVGGRTRRLVDFSGS